MYKITCDGEILYDPRGVDVGYSVHSPKVKLEVNTVGEGSFTIYNNHPNYDKLAMMKSIIEVSDDVGVIFRGRMTENTMDFNHGLAVDIEGVMGFFNDSIVSPFKFPDDFKSNADYIAAKNSGNVVAFFLGWLIDRHNVQVQEFQRFKLGRVTVSDPNNYLYRYNEDWLSTWETIKTRLFESEIGGYLCIRYEADGNYIDYLSEFDETNSQEITFGENLLNMSNKTSSGGVFSAIIPIGAEVEKTITSTETSGDFEFGTSFETSTKIKYTVTIDDIADGAVKDDIYKSGKFLYSKSAVEKYGWICADPAESTFDDVTTTQQLLNKGVAMLTGEGIFMANTIEVSALDLHFTDEQIQSFRIYKKINVYSDSHGISASYPLSKLDIDILNPQNTKITVGKTEKTLTDKTTAKVNSAVQKVEASAENLFKEVSGSQTDIKDLQENKVAKDGVISSINQSAELIKILAEKINLVGAVTFSDLDAETQNKINSSGSGGSDSIIENWGYNGEETYIDGGKIYTGTVTADKINVDDLFAQDINMSGTFTTKASVYLNPGEPEIATIRRIISGADTTSDRTKYDFNGDGRVTDADLEIAHFALSGKWSVAEWDGAELSEATITINITNPEKAIRITATNMWGREIDQYFGVNSAFMNDNVSETFDEFLRESGVVAKVSQGGTGASTAKEARENLGVAMEWEQGFPTASGDNTLCGFITNGSNQGSFLLTTQYDLTDFSASNTFIISFSGDSASITKIDSTGYHNAECRITVFRSGETFADGGYVNFYLNTAELYTVNAKAMPLSFSSNIAFMPGYKGAIITSPVNVAHLDIDDQTTFQTTGKISTGQLSGEISTNQISGTLPIANGGTGATDAGTALSNLGGLACKRWTQTATAGADTLLCQVLPRTTQGNFLLNIVYTVNSVSVSDVYVVSMSYGSINIAKISDGGYVSANERTIKAWAMSNAFGGNGGGIVITLNPTFYDVSSATAYCSYVPLTSNMSFWQYEAGEQTIPTGFKEYKSLTTRNGKTLVDANFTEDTYNSGNFYRMVDGVKEWLNPPFIANVEYRTTERHLGKVVYAKNFDCGICGKGRTQIVINLPSNYKIVRYFSEGSPFFYGDQKPGYNMYDFWVAVFNYAINIHKNDDGESQYYCTIFYTKD